MSALTPADRLIVAPESLDMSHFERREITFDYTADLDTDNGEQIVSVLEVSFINNKSEAIISDALDGVAVPGGAGLLVTQWVRGYDDDAVALFHEDEEYKLTIVALTTTGRRLSPYLLINGIF